MEKEAQRWTPKQRLKTHVEMHSTGAVASPSPGPVILLISHSISARSALMHDQTVAVPAHKNPTSLHTPGLNENLSSQVPHRTHIPKAVEEAWAGCLLAVLSGITKLVPRRGRNVDLPSQNLVQNRQYRHTVTNLPHTPNKDLSRLLRSE